jgi:hypothetical protein
MSDTYSVILRPAKRAEGSLPFTGNVQLFQRYFRSDGGVKAFALALRDPSPSARLRMTDRLTRR